MLCDDSTEVTIDLYLRDLDEPVSMSFGSICCNDKNHVDNWNSIAMMFDIFAYRVTVDNRCDETGIPVTVKYPAAAMNAPPQCTRHICATE